MNYSFKISAREGIIGFSLRSRGRERLFLSIVPLRRFLNQGSEIYRTLYALTPNCLPYRAEIGAGGVLEHT